MNAVVAKTTLQLERVKRCIVDEYCRVTHNDSSYTSRRDLVKVSCGRNYLRYLLTQKIAALQSLIPSGMGSSSLLHLIRAGTVPVYHCTRHFVCANSMKTADFGTYQEIPGTGHF